jgi:mycothiol maleylpyruvate isomerase-like protein
MPVSAEFARSNQAQTERLRRLVGSLSPQDLRTRLPNGWTVSVALAHLAFWDRHRIILMKKWAAGQEATGAYDGNVFNDGVQPLLEAIPPEQAAKISIEVAEEVDRLLLELPDEVVATALARPDAPNLNRGLHRQGHLDVIDKALGRR